jgi:hypothetical protein
MARTSKFVPVLAALVLTLSMPTGLRAFAECTSESGAPSAEKSEVSQAPDFDGIVSLKLRINNDGKITILDKSVVSGRWQDNRNIPVGPCLYYEVIDESGNVISRGFRRDPRNMHSSRYEDFLLTTPYKLGATSVNIYIMDYENGGRGGYARDFSLLASVDIRGQMTALAQ